MYECLQVRVLQGMQLELCSGYIGLILNLNDDRHLRRPLMLEGVPSKHSNKYLVFMKKVPSSEFDDR